MKFLFQKLFVTVFSPGLMQNLDFLGGLNFLISFLKFGDKKPEKEKPLIYFHFRKKSP
jgi:hypothetical protein